MKNVSIKKYDYIDALRGFAILGVVLVHSSQWVKPTSSVLYKIVHEGTSGIQLFYVASALTLFLSMSYRKTEEEQPILSFFIRRFFRIAPLFYLAIIVYTAYYGIAVRYFAPNGIEWWYILLTATFVNGWHPETITSVVPGGWSIAVEMTFYCFVPYLFIKLKDIRVTLIALLITVVLARILTVAFISFYSPFFPESQQYLIEHASYFWFFSQLPVFILGILLFHVIKLYPKGGTKTASYLLYSALFFFLFFIFTHTYIDIVPKHYLYGIVFVVFALSLHYSPRKLFVNRITVLIGKLSFSIYIVHTGVLLALGSLFSKLPEEFRLAGDGGFVFAFLLVLMLSIGVSYVSYKLVEIPGINLGKRVISRL